MKILRRRLLSLITGIVLVVSSFGTFVPPQEVLADASLTTETPVLVVSGTGITGEAYSADNVSLEKSYTMNELKALDTSQYLYSTINTSETLSVYRGEGAKVKTILDGSAFSAYDSVPIYVIAPDGYTVSMDPAVTEPYFNPTSNKYAKNISGLAQTRYFFPKFNELPPSTEAASETPAIIAWAMGGERGNAGSQEAPQAYEAPDTVEEIQGGKLRLMVGQLDPADVSNPAWNGDAVSFTVQAGNAVEETVLTFGNSTYTRKDILMMNRADGIYSYETSGGAATDYVRGVPMSVLLDGYNADDIVSFESADGYGVAASGKTVGELIENDYMLAYEKGADANSLAGIYDTAKKDPSIYGFLALYGADADGKPAKMVNSITVTSASGEDYSTSPYKHITYDGAPYNLDSITGATLTIEGPGVTKSVPVSVRDLEGRNAGIKRADYTDKRNGSQITRKYEGLDLYYILHGMTNGDNGIVLTENAQKVKIKNRNRNTIAEFTLDQIEEAHEGDKPILVAYGTSLSNGERISPFVFNNGAGADPELGNEDGCIKLVYDPSEMTMLPGQNANYTMFGNMAYIYVEEGDPPGYKHNTDPYQSPDISNYVLTVTGEKIGREVNYTVGQLEDMVEYGEDGAPDNTGMGYRDEYSLANSTYWYVNEYEGVQLWKLLLRSGLDPAYASDEETIVSSTATDGYAATDKFTTAQVADPDRFGFYEKNPADLNDGTYPGNENIRQGDDVSTGDKLSVGYPVLVAYGVNGYPYVEKASQAGYMSGLQNDGGPLRIISGKKEYTHANGSNQAKLLDKVLVGDDTYHYSTHKYSNDPVYTDMAENNILEIKILNGSGEDAPVLKEVTYKVGDIEELIYGGSLTRTQLAEAKVKTFYQLSKNGTAYSDLYEGINLNWFLRNIVEIPGYKGTVTFSNGTTDLALDLEEVLATSGSNTETEMEGLAPLLAYGKNGYPMVVDKNAGYVKDITLAEGTEYENKVTVKNDGGPLAVLFPHTGTEVSDTSMTSVNKITINLSADKYAHIAEPYNAYQDDVITVSGEGTRLTEAKNISISELEGKQTIAFTGDYSILKDGAEAADQTRYRGIKLYQLLTSTAVGLKSNADMVKITTTDGQTKEFTLSEIRKADYINSVTGAADLPVILAYGVGIAGNEDMEDGLPLVAEKSSDGYDSAYKNNGGPIRLVVGQTDASDVNSGKNLKYVSSIEVTASEMTSWNHSVSEIYRQYLTETINLTVVDREGNELYNKDYTVEEIEANADLVERVVATVVQEFTWEGIDFWKFVLQEVGDIPGVSDPVTVDVAAADGFSQELRSKFGLDGLNNGIKDGELYVPIILAYGVGGSPLVIGDKSHPNGEGYDATVGNNGGPIRLVTHNSQGTSLTYVKKIKITVGDSVIPVTDADFVIKGLEKDIELSVDDIAGLKNSVGDDIGKAVASYTWKKGTDTVKGVYLKDLLAVYGIDMDTTVFTVNATDGYEATEASYQNILLKDAIAQNYFVAYAVQNEDGTWEDIADADKTEAATVSAVRIYRNYNEALGNDPASDWRNRCTNISGITVQVPEKVVFKEYKTDGGVRSTSMDADGNLWVGTYGGGLYEKEAGADGFTVYNTKSEPALKTNFCSAVAVDADGGVWFSQNASYTDPTGNQGLMYLKDGVITQYTAEDDPVTIPNNYVQAIKVDEDGKVWMGSFGGLTIYDPAAGTWTTYSKDNTPQFPATSVNTIVFDGNGKAWLGFYPDGSSGSYSGGFCLIDGAGNVSKVVDAVVKLPEDAFANSWSRNFAIDKAGRVWAICSGTNVDPNVGGVVYCVDGDTVTSWTGDELFGDYLDGAYNTEVRVVAVDPDGALWFGTSADGVLKVDDPTLTADGKMTVTAQYAKETGSWSAENMNNVYSIDFWNDGTAYVGSAGGVQVLGDEPEKPEEEKEIIGGETEETAQFKVTGDGTVKLGYFSIKSLKNTEGIVKVDATYSWTNSAGTNGSNTFQGVYLDNLLRDVIGLKKNADSITVIASDGYKKTFDISMIDTADREGHKPMIAWQSDEDTANPKINPKLVIGQSEEGESNKKTWMSDVIEIKVGASAAPEPKTFTVSGAEDKPYTGKPVTQNLVVKSDDVVLTEGTDYEVVFKNNVKPGAKAEYMVTGKGDYDCTVTGTFRVLFKDVPANHNYYDAIYWLADEGIGAGYSGDRIGNFGPSDNITRGQVVMFIWRAAGMPEPKSTKQQFSDVGPSNNFFKAVQWAAEKNITKGYTSGAKKGTFGYKENCTRGQIVTFLLRYVRLSDPSAGPVSHKQQFKDVPTTHGFYEAVQWAYENGVTKGYSDGTFGVSKNCTRGQCAVFIYKALK